MQNENSKKTKGREKYRKLISECFRIFNEKGYKIEIEKKLENGARADLYVTNGETIIIACLVRPSLQFVRNKIDIYAGQSDKLIICYPSDSLLKFPIKELVEVLPIDIEKDLKTIEE